MDLLTNAIESIQVGVEDWQAGTRPRILSAVRNIHAGILLLFKEALLRESPDESNEVLVKAISRPVRDENGGVRHVGVGRKTVNTRQIQDRFSSLGITTDWKRFLEIAQLRNDIEHYYADVTSDSVIDLIPNAFILIRAFIRSELDEDPQELLGQKAWDAMLRAEAVYRVERAACDEALAATEWGTDALLNGVRLLRCAKCGSDLLTPTSHSAIDDMQLACRNCASVEDASEFVPRALSNALELERFFAFDDGDDDPVAVCPSCGSEAYILSEDRCAHCGDSVERECSRCGTTIPGSELGSSPLCGYCEHMMSKDD